MKINMRIFLLLKKITIRNGLLLRGCVFAHNVFQVTT
ncbi:hypothetical protein S1001342_01336 [Acetobacter pasteurianus subsp. pasteurianus]|uniref:Uncharacterized protein n=1 Tax=Acetobacter pasteurianus subsp. pasteurianus TaxID=481145 RepID=A0A1Y0Y650_ACEPA|nr:hypothetical protein S1001342_01336 [Acetobacter pasteurianus subsp. pasteurianus]